MKSASKNASEAFYTYQFSNPKIKALTSYRPLNGRFEDVGGAGDRQKLFSLLNLKPERAVGIKQVHGSEIQIVTARDGGRGSLNQSDALCSTDGLITNEPRLILTIQTADCLPLFITDPEKKILCLLHCGWRSLKCGIIEKGIQLIKAKFNSRPDCLEARLGPSLQFEDFEVGDDFIFHFPTEYFKKREDGPKHYFDAGRYASDVLISNGFLSKNIINSRRSTLESREKFFSYRRDGVSTGRMLSLLWREA